MECRCLLDWDLAGLSSAKNPVDDLSSQTRDFAGIVAVRYEATCAGEVDSVRDCRESMLQREVHYGPFVVCCERATQHQESLRSSNSERRKCRVKFLGSANG